MPAIFNSKIAAIVLTAGLLASPAANAETRFPADIDTATRLSASLNQQFNSDKYNKTRSFIMAIILLEMAKKKKAEKALSNPKHLAWCNKRYRSYDQNTDTFQPYKGPRKPCRSPHIKSARK